MAAKIREAHGTNKRYKRGCKCQRCCEAHDHTVKAAQHMRRGNNVEMVPIDPALVRMMILATTDKPLGAFGREVLGPTGGDYLNAALRRGKMEVYRLDTLAVALGTHMASLVPGFMEVSEQWAQEGAVA